jgi:hypothetical protein
LEEIIVKNKKILGILMACTMISSMVGSLAVGAEEYSEGLKSPYSDKGNYTFEYLSELTKDDFFAINGAEELYNEVVSDVTSNQMMMYSFSADTFTDEKYVWFESEKEIKVLFDGISGFDITSPLVNSDVFYDNYVFAFSDDDVLSGMKIGETAISEVTDADYLYFAKTWFCLNQVADFTFLNGRTLDGTGIAYGDVNEDEKFDVRDAAAMAKKLAEQKASELTEVSDFNKDSKYDVRDCAVMARFFAAKGAANASGLFEKM